MRGRRWFLTYPRSDFDIPQYKQWLVDLLAQRGLAHCGLMSASEHHADGGLHRHFAFDLGEGSRLSVSDERFFDYQGRHPSIELCKSWRASVIYLSKEDDFESEGFDVEAVVAKKRKLCDEVAELVAAEGVDAVATSFPGYFMLHRRQIDEYASYLDESAAAEVGGDELEFRVDGGDETEVVQAFLDDACGDPSRFETWQIGMKGLWLWGSTALGKTTAVNVLAGVRRCYFAAAEENFVDGFRPRTDQVVVFDEFDGQVPLGYFLQMTGGGRATLRTKGGQMLMSGHRPVIVCSNSHPLGLWPNETRARREALMRRFGIVELLSPIKLEWRPKGTSDDNWQS